MPDKTRIVFSNGHELIVAEEPSQVQDRLIAREPFHKFKKSPGDVDIYIPADNQIAYIERVPESQPSAPAFAAPPRPSRHEIG